jgi:hypothetical protein
MAQSVPIAALGTASAPEDYTIPNSLEIVPLAVRASFDGSGASGPFYPTLEFIAPGGNTIAECPCFTIVAAGGSADVTWFHIDQGTNAGTTQSSYEQLVLSNAHLRLYYKLDETSGTVMGDSGPLGVNGVYNSAPTLGQPPLADGKSAVFSAAGAQYGSSAPGSGIVGTGEMTVLMWIKTNQAPGGVAQFINADDNNFRYFQFRMTNLGKVQLINFSHPNAPPAFTLTGTVTVNDNTKHMIAGTLDTAGTQTIYVDGVQDVQALNALPTLSTRMSNLQIAGRLAGGPPLQNDFSGTVDEVSIYNFNLSAAEIAALYAAGA